MIKVLLVDDNGPVRKSLRALIETADDLEIVASAENGVDAVEKARSYNPDVAVMDISMPIMDGLEATEHIRECCRLTRVIILSTYESPEYVRRSLEVGAKGYVIKDTAGEELVQAIHAIQEGGRYFSEKIAEMAMKYLAQLGLDH